MQPTVAIVIQARLASRRLPGKVLAELDGRPLIEWVIHRARCNTVGARVYCAIADTPEDQRLAQICEASGAPVFFGPEADALSRYVGACERFELEHVVRITGDCPLIDPRLIDRHVRAHLSGAWDLTANDVDREGAFPRGQDVEVVRAAALASVLGRNPEPRHREHVTAFLYEHPDEFAERILPPEPGEARPDLRLCVDETEDLELVRRVCRRFRGRRDFSYTEIVALLDREPEIRRLNARHNAWLADHPAG